MKMKESVLSNRSFRLFGRSEYKELLKLLSEDETVYEIIYGYYQGGSGLLVATSKRLMLIDKQPFYTNLEDISYRHISDVACKLGRLQSALSIRSGSHILHFRSLSDKKLKNLYFFVESKAQQERSTIHEVLEQPVPANPTQKLMPLRKRVAKYHPLDSIVKVNLPY